MRWKNNTNKKKEKNMPKIESSNIEVLALEDAVEDYRQNKDAKSSERLYEAAVEMLAEIYAEDKHILPEQYNAFCDKYDIPNNKVCPKCGEWDYEYTTHVCDEKKKAKITKRRKKKERKEQKRQDWLKHYHPIRDDDLQYISYEWDRLEEAIEEFLLKTNQKIDKNYLEFESPLYNTGAQLENDVLKISAYCWDENDKKRMKEPNFLYKPKNLTLHWYKHAWRGLYTTDDTTWQMISDRSFSKVIDDCIESFSLA